MKATKAGIGRAIDQPAGSIHFYLFHGPDEGQSRALAARLLEALGAAKFIVAAGAIKADPASLVDEAAAMSLFGGRRAIWIEPATKDIEEGVAALLGAEAVESAVIAIAGSLPASSPLRKLAESSPHALAHAAYLPEGRDAERMVIDVGRRSGLRVSPDMAARIGDRSGSDQAIIAQEMEKFALYLGASPEFIRELDQEAVDAVGAESAEGDFQRLADLALIGEMNGLAEELARLPSGGNEAIPVVRSLQRRLLMLASLRARIDSGERPDAVMASVGKGLFWKDKAKVQQMLARWSSERLATLAERAGKLERSLLFRPAPRHEALGEELLTIARKARSGTS